MVEPIAVGVSPRGEFVVVDNGAGILVFDQCGKLIRNCHKSRVYNADLMMVKTSLDCLV